MKDIRTGGTKDSDRLLTTGQASRVLNVHVNTIRRWSDLGIIESYRIGLRGDRRFRLGDLATMLVDGQEGKPPSLMRRRRTKGRDRAP
jgi:excisionase family DNA binding protein